MANLTESPIYESGIFQLEKTTPPLGGAPVIDNGVPSAGHANAQASQLANRTAWLKSQLDLIEGEIEELYTSGTFFKQDGTGAVDSTVNAKIKQDIVSVLDFGAGVGGDDSAAFSLAAKAAKSSMNITGARGTGGIPRAQMCQVQVPDGVYNLTTLVDVGNKYVTWVLTPGAVVSGYNLINGNVLRPGQRHTSQSTGSVDYACGYSIRVNNPEMDAIAEVTGVPTEAGFGKYGDRDSVGLYVDNTSRPGVISAATATYTATTATIAPQSADTVKKLQVGMFIDTVHTPFRYTGILKSWNADASVLTVNGWYLVNDNVNSPSTPTGTLGLKVNAYTKVWSHNANIYLMADGAAKGATGFEQGIYNYLGDAPISVVDSNNRTWGFDAVSLGDNTFRNQAGHITRGKWVYHCASYGDITYPYAAFDEANYASFLVDKTGSMELGKNGNGVAAPVFIDMHTSGSEKDYDVRLIASGGTTAVGQGTYQIAAAKVITNAMEPATTALFDFGTSLKAWRRAWFGTVDAGLVNAGAIELGGDNTAVATTRVIDTHTSGNNNDYDARLEFSGGTNVSGQGAVTIRGASLDLALVTRPATDLGQPLGQPARRFSTIYGKRIYIGDGTVWIDSGTGSPEGVQSAPRGSQWMRTDGTGASLYVKESGTGNTGWVAK